MASGVRVVDLSPAQRELIFQELGRGHPAAGWLARVLGTRGYCRELAATLLAAARDGTAHSWHTRHLCALLLEHLARRLPATLDDEHLELFAGLGLLDAAGSRLRQEVLREGFSSLSPASFAAEFARRLARNGPLHQSLERSPDSVVALRRLLVLSFQECRVLLARYLIEPQEVVERFLQEVRSGLASVSPALILNTQSIAEADHLRRRLPELEAEIVRQLVERNETFWVSERPRQMLNSMIEYPLGTVALVLKPPGSWIELQFKRAGRPRACPLGVTWLRADGGTAPYQHQLDGGGYGKGLEWESAAASKTSDLFRQVHGLEAPVSRAVCVQTVSMVPAPRGPVDVMNYFTDPGVFASDYAAMRAAMHSCVGQAEKGPWPTPATDDDTRLTLEFLVAMKPSQGILVGSSSFRVDRVAAYLSAEGDRLFYQEGLGRAAEPGEARGLADTLLAEILPAYRPPDSSCATYCRYVDDAFRVPENRRQADRAYRGLMAQAGLFWGTLLAFGAGSRGESFVARNVGIRTVWAEGRWATVLIFMDHDQLFFYGPRARRFWTLDSVPSMLVDEEYLVEMPADASDTESTFTFLDSIYRADETLREAGRAGFREALEAAYRKTRRKQQAGELRRFVTRTMVRGLTDWDECVRRFLAARASGAGESCESELRRWLAGRGYGKKSIAQYLEAMRKYTPFLAKYAFLFAAEAAARSADHG